MEVGLVKDFNFEAIGHVYLDAQKKKKLPTVPVLLAEDETPKRQTDREFVELIRAVSTGRLSEADITAMNNLSRPVVHVIPHQCIHTAQTWRLRCTVQIYCVIFQGTG